jgi:phospholipid-binding lipoprotein MlaA
MRTTLEHLAGALLVGLLLALPVRAAQDGADRDPFEAVNRPIHRFNETLDAHLVEPTARAYRRVTPDPVERAVVNFFLNLYGPVSITGALLQADPERTAVATGRFAVNTTLGIGGLFDPATGMGLGDTQEDIGQALEVWGLEDSPYLVLPFLGPMTLVQVPDRVLAAWLPPELLGGLWHPGLRVLDVVSFRADSLAATSLMQESAVDTYTFTREAFLQRRRYQRYNGDPPVEDWSDFLDDF